MKPNILKYISMLLVVVFVFSFVVPTPKAEAVVLEGYAVYALAGALVSVLAAAGVSFLSSNGNAEKLGSDIIDSFDTFLEQSASAPAGTGVSSYRDDIASSITTSQDGSSFVVDSDTMSLLDQYTGWFIDEYSLSDSTVQLFNTSFCGDILLGHHYITSQSFTFQNTANRVISHAVTLNSNGIATIIDSYDWSFTPSFVDGVTVTSYSFSVSSQGLFYGHLHLSSGNTSSYSYPEYGNINPATSSVSASYTANSDYGFDGTGATVGTSDYSLSVVNGGNGSDPQQDPDADAATNLATTALTLALIGDLVSQLTEDDAASEPSDGAEVQTQFYSEVRLFFQNFWDNLTEALGNGLESIETLLGNIATAISNAATSVVSGISTAIDSIGDKIDDWKEESTSNLPPLPVVPTGFANIWHYVVEWLTYIGGFITLILSVWSALPYGLVVPVYACITLILVFGVYRRFIS